jgi:hypothetical protein
MRGAVLLLLAGLVAASCTDGRATPPGPTTAGPTTTTPPAPGAAAPSTAGPPAAASDSTGAASAKAAPAAATAATAGTVDVGAGLADLADRHLVPPRVPGRQVTCEAVRSRSHSEAIPIQVARLFVFSPAMRHLENPGV